MSNSEQTPISDFLEAEAGQFVAMFVAMVGGIGLLVLLGISLVLGVQYYENRARDKITIACLAKPNTTPQECGIKPEK